MMLIFGIYNSLIIFCAVYINIATADSFSYTGGAQTYLVPTEAYGIEITACGAAGENVGAKGGCIACIIGGAVVHGGATLYVYVGGSDGYNGGGTGSTGGAGGGEW